MLTYHEYDNYKNRLMWMYFIDNSNIMNKISKETVQIPLDLYFCNISEKFLKLDKDHLVFEVATV